MRKNNIRDERRAKVMHLGEKRSEVDCFCTRSPEAEPAHSKCFWRRRGREAGADRDEGIAKALLPRSEMRQIPTTGSQELLEYAGSVSQALDRSCLIAGALPHALPAAARFERSLLVRICNSNFVAIAQISLASATCLKGDRWPIGFK